MKTSRFFVSSITEKIVKEEDCILMGIFSSPKSSLRRDIQKELKPKNAFSFCYHLLSSLLSRNALMNANHACPSYLSNFLAKLETAAQAKIFVILEGEIYPLKIYIYTQFRELAFS